jgi:uncharacterized membrane protein
MRPLAAVTPASVRSPQRAASVERIASIDVVRGAVLLLMALDHVRDWVTNVRFQPEDLTRTSVPLFMTRWLTHFCAPAFFLLAGLSIGLLQRGGMSPRALSKFLLIRGVWLLALELLITPVGWQFGLRLLPAFALVLWALGWSMILLAVLVRVPSGLLAAVSLVVIGGHNLLDAVQPEQVGVFGVVWRVLHVPGFAVPGVLFIAYPLVPWVAVMALGFALAGVYGWDAVDRRRFLLRCGLGALAAFIGLRLLNAYGDPIPWLTQRTPWLTAASFLNVRKYPPSLDFLLMTLGPALIALAFTDRVRLRGLAGWLAVYGRVPLFFYVSHIVVAHGVAVVLAAVQGGELRRIQVVNDPQSIPGWYGVPLPGVYMLWLLVVLILFVPCRQYGAVKHAREGSWLRYV